MNDKEKGNTDKEEIAYAKEILLEMIKIGY